MDAICALNRRIGRMARKRDSQRSKVYAWERRASGGTFGGEHFKSLDEVAEYAKPIWRAERGRYGKARYPVPRFESGRGRGVAYGSGLIMLGRPSRNPWVVLHEMAHCLTHDAANREGHGPRFVGVLIGLLARHAGQSADELMALADEMGVKYHVRSIGAVPVTSLPERLATLMPIGYMDAAFALDVSYRQVYGAALNLIRHGRARWRGRTLVPAVTG